MYMFVEDNIQDSSTIALSSASVAVVLVIFMIEE